VCKNLKKIIPAQKVNTQQKKQKNNLTLEVSVSIANKVPTAILTGTSKAKLFFCFSCWYKFVLFLLVVVC
jgi:hypothetical protein